ncbi:unnamed protein product [Linum trigynum]|uniref:Reverse transcriptase Ty1/copia-type domain-containing protein n=1 Tax=Linum trigynum TaxID=586398 RepID=A0AAV2DFM2_9ROSI
MPKRERHKLAPKAARCVFLGYSDRHKGYLCYDPENPRLRIAYHVVFMEQVMYFSHSSAESRDNFKRSLSFLEAFLPAESRQGGDVVGDHSPGPHLSEDTSSIEESSSHTFGSTSSPSSTASSTASLSSTASSSSTSSSSSDDDDDEPEAPAGALELRRSTRSTKGQPPVSYDDFVGYATNSIPIPSNYRQACGIPKWDATMTDEVTALEANQTWDVVDRTPDMSVVGSKWVYNIKMNPDGSLECFKARVVAQGFSQEYGIDYDETFALVAKMKTVRCVLAVAAMRDWPLVHLDVKNAFLHGDLKETIYMACPPGYSKGGPDKVCRLKRSLYGLKQAPRAWFEKFHGTVIQAGFVQSQNDPSLFLRTTSQGITILLLSGSDQVGIRSLTSALHQEFKLKELGDVSYFLGLEIERSDHSIFVSQ